MPQGLTLVVGSLELTLLPEVGGSIASFSQLDESGPIPILRGSGSAITALETACFPLVPFSNRIRDGRFTFRGRQVELSPNMAGDPSPLHGQGWLAEWRAEASSDRYAELYLVHEPAEWPWRYAARQQFDLDEGGLTAQIECTNEDESPMPCGLGFHPYFPCTRSTRLQTRVETVWTVDDRILPVSCVPAAGRYDISDGPVCGRALDNGYGGWSGEASIDDPALPFTLRLSSTDAGYFQLFSPPGGELIAAEPVSHANAAMNAPESEWPSLGLRILDPGESMSLTMRLDVEPR
jgi:aldose 1-epimerase